MNPNVNYELWVIMMYQCRFTDSNKRTTLVQDADRGGGCAYVRARSIWELSVLCQFCCEPKTALLKKSILNKIYI